jgi:pilus assembly protein Flp/PilA
MVSAKNTFPFMPHVYLIRFNNRKCRAIRTRFVRGRAETAHRSNQQGVTQMSKIVAFLKNESGATAIEYGLIAAGISVAIIAVVNGLGTKLNDTFSSVSTQLK